MDIPWCKIFDPRHFRVVATRRLAADIGRLMENGLLDLGNHEELLGLRFPPRDEFPRGFATYFSALERHRFDPIPGPFETVTLWLRGLADESEPIWALVTISLKALRSEDQNPLISVVLSRQPFDGNGKLPIPEVCTPAIVAAVFEPGSGGRKWSVLELSLKINGGEASPHVDVVAVLDALEAIGVVDSVCSASGGKTYTISMDPADLLKRSSIPLPELERQLSVASVATGL